MHVTPRASSARVVLVDERLRVRVTEPPEDGRATEAVRDAMVKGWWQTKSNQSRQGQ